MINILVGIFTLISTVVLLIRYRIHSKKGALCTAMMFIVGFTSVFCVSAVTMSTMIIRTVVPFVLVVLSKMQLKDDYNAYIEETLARRRGKASIVVMNEQEIKHSRKNVPIVYNPSLAG